MLKCQPYWEARNAYELEHDRQCGVKCPLKFCYFAFTSEVNTYANNRTEALQLEDVCEVAFLFEGALRSICDQYIWLFNLCCIPASLGQGHGGNH